MNTRTLVLRRETLTALDRADLARVAGGDSTGTAISQAGGVTCHTCDVVCRLTQITEDVTTVTGPITTVVSLPCG